MPGIGFDENKHVLQNRAATKGDDTLLILSERGGIVPQTLAETYRCGR